MAEAAMGSVGRCPELGELRLGVWGGAGGGAAAGRVRRCTQLVRVMGAVRRCTGRLGI